MSNFIATHREHCWRIGTTHWWLHRCVMVAGADSPQHLLFHINGTQIAMWTSTLYFVTVSLCKCADSPEPSLHASIWNIDTYCIVQWLYSLNRVYAAGVNSTQIAIWTSTWYFVTVTRLWRACANVQTCQSLRCQQMKYWYILHCPVTIPVQMRRFAIGYAAGVISTQISIWSSTWYFGTVTKAKVRLCKCADSPEPSLLSQTSIKSPFEPARDFRTATKAQTRSSKCAVSTRIKK